MKILVLFGAAGAGKDTVADHLVAKRDAYKYGVAYPLKELCCRLFGWEMARLVELDYKEEQSGHEIRPFRVSEICADQGIQSMTSMCHIGSILNLCTPDKTRREILQLVGTEGFRAIDPDHWLKQARLKVRDLATATGAMVVITDTRFLNEFDAFREMGGAVIRIDKLGGTGTEHSAHASEQEWRGVEPDLILAAEHGQIDRLLQLADTAVDGLNRYDWDPAVFRGTHRGQA